MYSLYIDTHYTEVCIVLFKDGKVLDKEIVRSTMKHSVVTMPSIQKVIERNNLVIKDVGEIIVVNGPGSFTGTRIAVTIGKTMAFLLNVPIKQVDSLMVKYVSLDTKDDKYVVIEDKNGAYVGHFKDSKALEEYKYVPNSEYKEFKKNNEVIDELEINYDLVYKYLEDIKPLNAHEVKPLYIKGIDALK
jgi:tRNA threonylcarbamoyl adenosine modification protein YeaZ